MGKKGKEEAPVEEEIKPEDEEEPAEPEILKLCFRTGSQLYYGDCKAGYKQRYGTFVRHGFGKLIDAAVTPAGVQPKLSEDIVYETVVMATYDGKWQDDAMTGPGTCKWSDGSSYEGAFAEGQMHGHGRFVWPDGSEYEGAWHQGTMHGQGRFDSRFDGSFLQGRFYRNRFLRIQDGSWVDILEERRRQEQEQVLRVGPGDVAALPLRVCALGGARADNPEQALANRREMLERALSDAQAAGLVPFLLADESLQESVLRCFRLTGQHPDQCVSVRVASVARRRKRDYYCFFFDAIQASLRSGSRFALVLEDDDGGMATTDEQGWLDRQPSSGTPTNSVPDDWKIHGFFDQDAFPIDVFRPRSFNGRNLAKLFLPEVVQKIAEEEEKEAKARLRLQNLGAGDPAAVAKPKEETPAPKAKAGAKSEKGRPSSRPAADEKPAVDQEALEREKAAAEAATREAAAAAAAAAPAGTGLTGHFFGPGLAVSPIAAGLPAAYFLRPTVAATGRVPSGLSEAEVRSYVVDRFGAHVPLKSAMVILLTGEDARQEVDDGKTS